MPSRCAIWARVSTDEQESGNQLDELRTWAARRSLDVAAEYIIDGATAGADKTARLWGPLFGAGNPTEGESREPGSRNSGTS